MSRPASDRERDLEAIRSTYERYRDQGRGRIWDLDNPGFARIIRDRDRDLVNLLRRSISVTAGHVLDLGAGDGQIAEVARTAGIPIGSWTGVDLDPGAVAAASASMPWASFIEGSGDALPFGSDSLNVVIASTLFSSLPSKELERSVASEVARVLVPGGWLLWYDLRYDNPMNRAVHGIARRRLKLLFPGWEAELRSTTLIPPLARRLGPLTRWAYGPLERLPLMRSHLVGRLRKRTDGRMSVTRMPVVE